MVYLGVHQSADLRGPADWSTLMDENPPLGGFLAKHALQVSGRAQEEPVYREHTFFVLSVTILHNGHGQPLAFLSHQKANLGYPTASTNLANS